jgi:AcrR family transcriptional regulator
MEVESDERTFVYFSRITSMALPPKGERTRQLIEDAAYALFLEKGFHGTSMRQIARRSGVAVGGLYNHFSSKEAIFKTILIERHPFRQIVPILLAAPGDTPEAFVRSAGAALVDELERRPDVLKLMFVEIVEFDGQNMPALFETILPQLEPLPKRFQFSSETLRDVPSLVLLRSFIGLFFSYFITQYLLGPIMPAEMKQNAFDHFVDIYLHGILAPVS